jgi:ubiquinol-cytochrome c reductase cytochrome c subunit
LWLAPDVKIHAQSSAPQQAAASALTPAGNAENGKKLFAADGCYQCHGYEAQGASGTGPRLAPNPMPFAQLSKYIRAPTGQMPPYTAKVLSESELADIYAFLQSQPPPPALDSVPLLKY